MDLYLSDTKKQLTIKSKRRKKKVLLDQSLIDELFITLGQNIKVFIMGSYMNIFNKLYIKKN